MDVRPLAVPENRAPIPNANYGAQCQKNKISKQKNGPKPAFYVLTKLSSVYNA